ncbi:hypothetical protein [Legionella cardiaca]|uniref:Uncharacterized protein n=1 Tax=Legionella cardiaca TaxID=1071983 RepID=A0ABY8AR55_9GAMM|nr:hypothetical protein [Legionella cardiaca]WED42701.1 hypothetical protein PXX05_12460 [Legionella cardiaca]
MKKSSHVSKKSTKEKMQKEHLKNVSGGSGAARPGDFPPETIPSAPLKPPPRG